MDEYTDEQRAIDRDLLEQAAKAAGIEGDWDDVESAIRFKRRPLNMDHWNPLNNDGDALRLAVRLNLHEAIRLAHRLVDDKTDFYAATRRSIVRAAAEIGRAK